MEVAAFRKIKRPWFRGNVGAYLLGDDEFGSWSFISQGSVGRWSEHGVERLVPLEHSPGVLRLIPHDAWWIASWWPDGSVFTDAVTPVCFDEGAWTWADLELDVRRDPAGLVSVEDEDEFDAAVSAGHMTADEADAARSIAQQLVDWLTECTPPFDDTGWRRFDAAAALGLAPLDAPPTA